MTISTRQHSTTFFMLTLLLFLFVSLQCILSVQACSVLPYSSSTNSFSDPGSILSFQQTTDNLTPGLPATSTIQSSNSDFLGVISEQNTSSLLDNPESLQFYYEGNDYCYGITTSGQEIFSFIDSTDKKMDVLQGSGTFTIRSAMDKTLTHASYISKIELIEEEQSTILSVTYQNEPDNSIQTIRYSFYPEYVVASVRLQNFETTEQEGVMFLERSFLNPEYQIDKKMLKKWIFPDNNDFPYQITDAFVSSHQFDEHHRLYSFVQGEVGNINEYFEYYPNDHFIVKNMPSNDLSLSYKLIFENSLVDSDPDYYALFKSYGSDFAVGITPTNDDSTHTTVFKNPSTQLNCNISNMKNIPISGTLDIEIYNYYGEKVLSQNLDLSIPENQAMNYLINLKTTCTKNGIYYLDYSFSDATYTHRELYPFSIFSDYTYTAKADNPFGISGVRFGDFEPNESTQYLLSSLGASNIRVGISVPEYVSNDYTLLKNQLKQLKENSIRVTGQFILLDNWQYPSSGPALQERMRVALDSCAPYIEECEIGNELNLIQYYPNSYASLEDASVTYKETLFSPGSQLLKEYGITPIAAGVGLSDLKWMQLMQQNGFFDESNILSTHAYSYPHSPDFTSLINIEHSFESSLKRIQSFELTHGDKTVYLSEMGLPTTPLNNQNTFSGVDLRTQADYGIREYLLALSYNIDKIQTFSLYDQMNLFKGSDPVNGEYHFGMFYEQDYYGRVMPKPYAVAYATMTQCLDGVEAAKEVPHTTTTRAFSIKKKGSTNPILAVWSTKYKLPNDAVTGTRKINLPWNNQWDGVQTCTFYALTQSTNVYSIDLMGNKTTYKVQSGRKVLVPVTGSPLFLYGASTTK